MIKTKDEILSAIKERFGEETDDTVLSLIEDVSDTFDDYEAKTSDATNWKEKYENNDKEWREKYRDRFFNTGSKDNPEVEDEIDEPKKPLRFEDLFTEKE